MRTETDFIGDLEIPDDALYGIHSLRAKENFPDRTPFHMEWYKAIGLVKKACYLTAGAYRKAISEKKGEKSDQPYPASQPDRQAGSILHLINAASEVSEGKYFEHFIVPAISGGAGTSINMNVNEIIANAALTGMGKSAGDYKTVDPIEDANIFQSTNDVIPTSLKVAAMFLLTDLEKKINDLRFVVEQLENSHRQDLRIGYTQMQEAVPTSFGKLFSTYNEALSRDWWRVSKCFERIKVVNLGGGAIGSGIAVPRYFIVEAIGRLQQLTGLPVTRSENLSDATSNLDSFVEVHATLKAHAVNLEKMVSDIRLLASDLCNQASGIQPLITLPRKQVGSSVMPGKINPVIPEFVISAAHQIYANDQLISSLCGQGCLELNAYIPVIGNALLQSLKLLIACDQTLKTNLFDGLVVNTQMSAIQLQCSPAITTALIPLIGYHKAGELARKMKSDGIDIFQANSALKILDESRLASMLKPENLMKLGYTLSDLES